MCFAPQRHTFSTSEPPKVVRTPGAFNILTWKCASRHNGVHFFDISTSKSGPCVVCFVHFDLEMCFAPQRRALFRHPNCQKWSAPLVFCTFWLGNVLRATTACNFSSLIWPAGSAPATLASLLFDSPEPQIIGKTQCLATFLPITLSLLLFFLLLFSLPLPCSAFHLSILSEVWLLNFLRTVIINVKCVIFYSYLGLPEGILLDIIGFPWIFHKLIKLTIQFGVPPWNPRPRPGRVFQAPISGLGRVGGLGLEFGVCDWRMVG